MEVGASRDVFRYTKHAPAIMHRDTLLEIYDRWADLFEVVRATPFRTPDGLDVHSLYNWYCRVRGTCSAWPQAVTDEQCRLLFVNDRKPINHHHFYRDLMRVITDPPKFFTLNDELTQPDGAVADLAFRFLLPRLFPQPSAFELPR
mmetsp:Transcript_18617/g.65809  ORF Transcript_18617/g.65809 Transcript_18617/m.65809 type:complete len:146 (-) Transcript_18617:736-1173(-)